MHQSDSAPRPSVWYHISNGEYEAAVSAADAEFAKKGSLLPLRNKLTALIMLERFQEASQLTAEIIRLDGGSVDRDFIFQGILNHKLNLEEPPFAAWECGLNAKYSDAAGGVEMWVMWLLHARRHGLSDQVDRAMSELKAIGEKCGSQWPGCAALIAQSQMSVMQLEPLLSEHPVRRTKQELQALFAHEASKPTPDIEALYRAVESTFSVTCLLPEFVYLWCFGRRA